MNKGSVIQFNENHKWCGSLGIITEVKEIHNSDKNIEDIRFMIGVPIPQEGTAFIYSMKSDFEIEYIGEACLTLKENSNENIN